MYGILNDGIKPSTVTFSPDKLAHLQQKYGDAFRVLGGSVPLKPAAPGTATIQPLWNNQPAKSTALATNSATVERRTKGSREALLKPVINVTTKQYFPCIGDAAAAIGANRASVGQQLKGKCTTIFGHHHRYATPEEIALKRMLTPKPA